MADQKENKDNKSLPFYELIGAPLTSLVRAEAQAVIASVEFIERLGFVHDRSSSNMESPVINLGQLRMITFTFTEVLSNGQTQESSVSLPLLSVIPIPIIKIQKSILEFSLECDEIKEEDDYSQMRSQSVPKEDYLSKSVINIMGKYGRDAVPVSKEIIEKMNDRKSSPKEGDPNATSKGAADQEVGMTEIVDIDHTHKSKFYFKLFIDQSDFPAGIVNILNLIQSNIIIEPVNKKHQAPNKGGADTSTTGTAAKPKPSSDPEDSSSAPQDPDTSDNPSSNPSTPDS